MIEVIGVKFKSGGKMYYFAPNNFSPAEGSYVVVETARGPECGIVAARRHSVADDAVTEPLKPILRLATQDDMQILEKNRAYMAEAMKVCEECIAARNLPMRLIDVECGFDTNKLIFYFTADSRIDFRELVRDLALAFHVRIELRQIGDRDEAKLLGGLGICGREFCCKGYLDNFQPISIKMAKEQGLALNPAKISGTCGRLMCCLRYENSVYDELLKLTPKVGSTVLLPGEPQIRAYVMEANLITGMLRVKPENSDIPVTVSRDQVERLQDASRRMTKEDLHKQNGLPGRGSVSPKPAAKPAADKSAQETKPERPQNTHKRQEHSTPTERPAQKKQSAAPQQSAPAAAPQSQAPTLHPEFGENRQAKSPLPAPPVRRTAPSITEGDFTEHRAAADAAERTNHGQNHPHNNNNQNRNGQNQQRRQDGHRRFHHNNNNGNNGGNGNNNSGKRYPNNRGNYHKPHDHNNGNAPKNTNNKPES